MIECNEWVENTWKKIERKLSLVALRSRDKIPYTSVNGIHDNRAETNINWWTNGFWGGMMWLMYASTGNDEYRITAECSEKLLDNALENYDMLDHDVGFLWHIVSGASYKLTGNKKSRTRNLFAAATLFSRFNVDGNYIKAWNGDDKDGRSIIDCLMNLPLLYWATEELGDSRFKKVAMRHADMALRDHIRADGSINHIVEHDVDNGKVLKIDGGQGYNDTSCWTRGLAWAIYGMALSYKYTNKTEYLEAAVRCAHYFIEHSKEINFKTPIDFKAPSEPQYFDSTAGVCTACGLLELINWVEGGEKELFFDAAIKILRATDECFADYNENTDSLVLMGSERYPTHESYFKGVHIPIIYGDFFYVEAITKLKKITFSIW